MCRKIESQKSKGGENNLKECDKKVRELFRRRAMNRFNQNRIFSERIR